MQINNRELSWLSFNERVLQEAQDKTVPLIQRLRFLGIFSNNQDEFIKVRVANLIRMNSLKGEKTIKTVEGYPVQDILEQVHARMEKSEQLFSRTYREILAEMEKNNLFVLNEKQLTKRQITFCRDYFSREINPLIVPLLVRKSTKLPFLSDKYIYHAVRMQIAHAKHPRFAIIRMPVNSRSPRFIELPSTRARKEIIFIDDIIRLCLDKIFFMFHYEAISAHTFKLIRDAQLTVDDDITKSLMEKMEEGLESRMHGDPVRLIYDKTMPGDLLEILISKLKLNHFQTQAGGRYHMLKHLMQFPVVDEKFEYESLPALPHPDLTPFSSILEVIREKDIFFNFPYHTFDHVIDLLREAAIDPKVEKICMTLYRTAERSKVINVLISAAENGKEVIVMEELMARFDEEQNVENSEKLLKAGIKVIHGFKGLKIHAKLIYIERKEKREVKGYAYIGTGNFNETTARLYTDFGLLTYDAEITQDVKTVFDFLVNPHKQVHYKQLIVSPYYMRDTFEKAIRNEIKNSRKGKEAWIYAKMNSLTDVEIIRLLGKAAEAGVKIKLIIRGACCLQPEPARENSPMKAISIVDKYLEHARMIMFHNGGDEKVYILSADWMTRNLDNRIEAAVPVHAPEIRETIWDVFKIQWNDTVKARDLAYQDENRYTTKGNKPACRSQEALYEYYKNKI
ncbi:MAG: polyphosphate kinase 1 [Tannerellaceae bacterium]|nr:polyphosphate kinase 1 [Tannerellaceae bacterium]